jgi:hypothetical protein
LTILAIAAIILGPVLGTSTNVNPIGKIYGVFLTFEGEQQFILQG